MFLGVANAWVIIAIRILRLSGLMGGSGSLSSPRLISKDGQLVFKPKFSSVVSSKVSTSIGIPIISSTSSGLKAKATFPHKKWTRFTSPSVTTNRRQNSRSESAQDRDVGLGEADSETSPKRESIEKAFQQGHAA
ncbi:hypothetical protein Tco_0139481 [Tanacetum coccineum]